MSAETPEEFWYQNLAKYNKSSEPQQSFPSNVYVTELVKIKNTEEQRLLETEDLSPIKDDIVALQTSVAAINASVDSMYDDVRSLKNMNDNPLAN